MGEYLSKTCCFDKGTLVTNENFTSRINSPVNFEFQRIIFDFPNIDQKLNEQFIDNQSPSVKPRMIRRTLSGVTENGKEPKFVRSFKRSLTYKGDGNFLKRAKKRMQTNAVCSMETPKEYEDFQNFTSKVKNYEGAYFSRPIGDLDCGEEYSNGLSSELI